MTDTERLNAALEHSDVSWAYYQMLDNAVREHMDALIVATQDPLGFVPGTNWDRFRQLHKRGHRFASKP